MIRYTGLNLIQINDLDMDIYLFYLREAYIHYMSLTKEGREYLEKCYIFEQTKPDRGALRERFGKKKGSENGSG